MAYLYYPPVCWMTPESAEINAGENTTLTMNIYGGTVDRTEFESGDGGTLSVTTPDGSSPYETTVTGINGGIATVTGRTYIGSTNVCTDTSTITVTGSSIRDPWFQVVDGNIHSAGSVVSPIPSTCTGSCIPTLITGASGLVSYSQTLSVGEGGINETGEEWQAETFYRGKQTGYAYFNRVL